MNIRTISRNTVVAAVALLMAASCKKVETPQPMGNAGQTIVKFIDGGSISEPGNRLVNMDLSLDPQVITAVDLRRDIPNNAELNKPMTIIIKNDPSVLTNVSADAVPLPQENFSFNNRVEVTGDEFKIVMQPGEFALPVNFNLVHANDLDLSKTYGLGFTIFSATADGKILEEQKSFVILLSSNNEYDGIYRLYSGFSRADQPGFVGVNQAPAGYYQPYYLVTQSASEVDASINTTTYGIVCSQIIWNATAGNYTYFTGVAPRLKVDKTTKAVTVVQGIAAVGTSVPFTQDASELASSKYYPSGIAGHPFADGKKTIVAHFRWTSGGIDRIAKDTFVYLQSR